MINNDIMTWFVLSLLTISAISIICYSLLTGWREWLAHKKIIAHQTLSGNEEYMTTNYGLLRIELADIRHRLAKLEKKAEIY